MIYRLSKKDCSWSLVSLKSEPSKICCLKHCPNVKIPDGWSATEKYDPNATQQLTFDIFVDETGQIVSDKLRPGSSESQSKSEVTSSGAAETCSSNSAEKEERGRAAA